MVLNSIMAVLNSEDTYYNGKKGEVGEEVINELGCLRLSESHLGSPLPFPYRTQPQGRKNTRVKEVEPVTVETQRWIC